MFTRLIAEIDRQIENEGASLLVQVVTLSDNRQLSIGAKRNRLVAMATGEYVCFIDDDDRIAPNYVGLILNALQTAPDVVGIVGEISEPSPARGGFIRRRFYHTIENRSYKRSERGYERPPNHLNPIRRDIAIRYKFEDMSMGEDTDYAMRICRDQVLQREVMIPYIIYYYDFRPLKDY